MSVPCRVSSRAIATLAALISLSVGASATVAPPPPPASSFPPREPLAMTLGLVARPSGERTAAALARQHGAKDVLLRVPPDDVIRALIDSTSVENIVASIERLQGFGSRYVVADSCRASAGWLRDRFIDDGFADVRLDTFRTWTFQDSVQAVNVIAYKEGTTKPHEVVILGGHYDSVTNANFADPLAPAPGADDNASGVAAVLEAARVLRPVPTERSIIFACWSAEEVGLRGSRAFVADAVAQGLDVVLYLNLDCVSYDGGEPMRGVIYADSSAIAVAGVMADIAGTYLDLTFTTTVQPIGASDQNSFWEAGWNVVDTSPHAVNPYFHTAEDVLAHLNPVLTRGIAAVNIVATAAAAGIVGTDGNLPPETTLVATCAAAESLVTMRPTFEWRAADFDGEVTGYEYLVAWEPRGAPEAGERAPADRALPGEQESQWIFVPPEQTSVTLTWLHEDTYRFSVRAIDDDGARDPTPASHAFATSGAFLPTLTVATNFLPRPRVFVGHWGSEANLPVRVFENERLVFTVASDASSYCGTADSVAFAVNDSTSWSARQASPHDFVFRPEIGDTAIYVMTRDENGATTTGKIALDPVAAPRDLPLLHVDDWYSDDVPAEVHDAFYDLLLADQDHVEWDPLEHVEGGRPSLPPMEELGRYRTVLWTLDATGGFLRPAQAETAYHYLEGYVRAGGNFILEGQSSLASFGGSVWYACQSTYAPGQFIHDHVGVDSLRNAGGNVNPSNPESYGYAFLGGIAADASLPVDVPVDTLGKWADVYPVYGGIPYCEIVRTTPGTRRLYLFDSYLNPTLDERPCATLRYPTDGTGTFATFGFPLYYLKTAPAIQMADALLDAIAGWQEPADLLSFDWEAAPESVRFVWYLNPPNGPVGCSIDRKVGPADSAGTFVRLNDEPILPGAASRFRFTDASVLPSRTYSYRLEVVEQCGRKTTHGPWDVAVPAVPPENALAEVSPNPCRGVTTIRYSVGEEHRWVALAIYDVAGRLVKTLSEGYASPTEYAAPWDGTNADGRRVASGVYFVRLRIGPSSLERKIVVLR